VDAGGGNAATERLGTDKQGARKCLLVTPDMRAEVSSVRGAYFLRRPARAGVSTSHPRLSVVPPAILAWRHGTGPCRSIKAAGSGALRAALALQGSAVAHPAAQVWRPTMQPNRRCLIGLCRLSISRCALWSPPARRVPAGRHTQGRSPRGVGPARRVFIGCAVGLSSVFPLLHR
jgi:hypothetical protein